MIPRHSVMNMQNVKLPPVTLSPAPLEQELSDIATDDGESIFSFAPSDDSHFSDDSHRHPTENSTTTSNVPSLRIRVTEEKPATYTVDVWKGECERPVGLGHEDEWPPSLREAIKASICDAYTLVRLITRSPEVTPPVLGGTVMQVPWIHLLNDGSWEILVERSYIAGMLHSLQRRYHDIDLDLKYEPRRPTAEDVEYWGSEEARELYARWFDDRKTAARQSPWYIIRNYFDHYDDVPSSRVHVATVSER